MTTDTELSALRKEFMALQEAYARLSEEEKAVRAERDELKSALARLVGVASERDAALRERAEALASVAALRAALERLIEDGFAIHRDGEGLDAGDPACLGCVIDAALGSTAATASEHDAKVAAEARRSALEEAANHVARGMVMIASPDRVKTCAAIVADLRALAEPRPEVKRETLEDEPAPCGGSRCHKADDGTWIHSSKSYGTCSVQNARQAPLTLNHQPSTTASGERAEAPAQQACATCGHRGATLVNTRPVECGLQLGHVGDHMRLVVGGHYRWADGTTPTYVRGDPDCTGRAGKATP